MGHLGEIKVIHEHFRAESTSILGHKNEKNTSILGHKPITLFPIVFSDKRTTEHVVLYKKIETLDT